MTLAYGDVNSDSSQIIRARRHSYVDTLTSDEKWSAFLDAQLAAEKLEADQKRKDMALKQIEVYIILDS